MLVIMDDGLNMNARLCALLKQVDQHGSLPADLWPADSAYPPSDLGLTLQEGALRWREDIVSLDLNAISDALPDREVELFPVIDSTNSYLMMCGQAGSVVKKLALAEFQTGGRGRRGRKWSSPYAQNLAMSVGMQSRKPLAELGGLSLIVGLALASVLTGAGARGVGLKWPNDLVAGNLQAGFRKLAGILVELIQQADATECVLGIGINVSLSAQDREHIDQPVDDLRSLGVLMSRNDLVVALVREIDSYLALFEAEGFTPFVTAFNENHVFHEQNCAILQGENRLEGCVRGVGEQGELLFETVEGMHRIHGGEVSLRR